MAQDVWICEICGVAITEVGLIELIDRRSAEMPGYDPDEPQQLEALGERGEILPEETTQLQVQAALDALNDPGVEFHVRHLSCGPRERPQGRRYDITTDRAARIEQWAAWVSHLAQKNWMKRPDLIQAIRFWCRGHGLTIPTDLL